MCMHTEITEIIETVVACILYVIGFYELIFGQSREALLYIVLAYLILVIVGARLQSIQARIDTMLREL